VPGGDERQPRLPTGSFPIDETAWSGDHRVIKEGIGAYPTDNVFIDHDENVWLENPDGTFTNFGQAASFTASGKPKGRRGKDRARRD
jgi:hypothetical protein